MRYSGIFITYNTHMKDLYSTIYSKQICRVALNPLFVKDCNVQDLNIRRYCNSRISANSKYDFKDVSFRAENFTCLKLEE